MGKIIRPNAILIFSGYFSLLEWAFYILFNKIVVSILFISSNYSCVSKTHIDVNNSPFWLALIRLITINSSGILICLKAISTVEIRTAFSRNLSALVCTDWTKSDTLYWKLYAKLDIAVSGSNLKNNRIVKAEYRILKGRNHHFWYCLAEHRDIFRSRNSRPSNECYCLIKTNNYQAFIQQQTSLLEYHILE